MLDPLYNIVAQIVLFFHRLLSPVFGQDSGVSWALSIVLLTVTMRLLLFPLFVKQIKSQRAMQALQPKVKELQAKHKNDRERLNREMMALYKENNANPIAGCLPLLLQMPVFFALFNVLNKIKPDVQGGELVYAAHYGISRELVESAATAKVFGAPIAASFNSPSGFLQLLDASAGTVRLVAAVMVVLMGASTFITQKQMMKRSGPLDAQQAQIQRFMLYVLPFSFAVTGFLFPFPVGVLLYWLTTNLWSMGQQAYVIRRMPPALGGGGAGGRSGSGGSGGSGPSSTAPRPADPSAGTGSGSTTRRRARGSARLADGPTVDPSENRPTDAPPARSTPLRTGHDGGSPAHSDGEEPAVVPAAGRPVAGGSGARRGPSNQPKRRNNRRGGRR